MYIFFDTETAGLPLDYNEPATNIDNWPRLVSLAYIKTDDVGKELERKNFIVKVKFQIENSHIHGITNEMATATGVHLPIVLIDFYAATIDCTHMVAHNMQFDSNVVMAEWIRANLRNKYPRSQAQKVCTMEASWLVMKEYLAIKNEQKPTKGASLPELYNHLFGKEYLASHDAMKDTEAMMACFFELKKLGILKG